MAKTEEPRGTPSRRPGSPRRALEGGQAPDPTAIPAIIDRYIADLEPAQQAALREVRETVIALDPGIEEALSYGMPAFRYHDRMVLWYMGAKAHCSLFPTAAVIDAHRADLEGFRLSKGTIQFTPDNRVSKSLLERMVRDRMARIDRGEKP